MTLREVRKAVLSHLAHGGEPRFNQAYLVGAVRGPTSDSAEHVWEALWSLVADGLIFLDPNGQAPDNWAWRLSAEGQRVAAGGVWEPRDPDGYLDRLKRDIPNLDGLVELYMVEALHSFNANCYLATSVMLGVAAERAFIRAAEAFANSPLPGAPAIASELGRGKSNYFALWSEFRKRIEPNRDVLPEGLADSLTLDAIADLIRVTRNEAGHPSGKRIDEDTARVQLTIAAVYLRKMQQLADHLNTI